MTPELASSWMDVLTQGKGLIITGAVILMLAGIGLTILVGLCIAYRMGVFRDWRKRIEIEGREVRVMEAMVELCKKEGLKVPDLENAVEDIA